MAKKAYHKPTTRAYVRYSLDGTRHIFATAAEAEWFTTHTDARRVQAMAEGSLAALVCDSTWRLSREL